MIKLSLYQGPNDSVDPHEGCPILNQPLPTNFKFLRDWTQPGSYNRCNSIVWTCSISKIHSVVDRLFCENQSCTSGYHQHPGTRPSGHTTLTKRQNLSLSGSQKRTHVFRILEDGFCITQHFPSRLGFHHHSIRTCLSLPGPLRHVSLQASHTACRRVFLPSFA